MQRGEKWRYLDGKHGTEARDESFANDRSPGLADNVEIENLEWTSVLPSFIFP